MLVKLNLERHARRLRRCSHPFSTLLGFWHSICAAYFNEPVFKFPPKPWLTQLSLTSASSSLVDTEYGCQKPSLTCRNPQADAISIMRTLCAEWLFAGSFRHRTAATTIAGQPIRSRRRSWKTHVYLFGSHAEPGCRFSWEDS